MEEEKVIINQSLNAPIEKVWKALTSKNEMKNWYFDIPDFELKEGAFFNFFEPGGEKKYHHRCVILEIITNQKFQHTWTYPALSNGVSVVTWELTSEADNSTRVFLTHKGIEKIDVKSEDFTRESYLAGWTEIVGSSLKKFVEE